MHARAARRGPRHRVHVLDGTGITYSSLSEEKPEGVVTILGIRLHALASGEGFDLARGRPILAGA